MAGGAVAPEFSRRIKVSDVPRGGLAIAVSAAAAEREALARRFGLDGLARLAVEGRAVLTAHGLRVELSVAADARQTCVVTMEPMTTTLQDDVRCEFRRDLEDAGEVSLHWGADDPPEPLVNEQVDIGELAADVLGAMIDPYPRRDRPPAADAGPEAGDLPGRRVPARPADRPGKGRGR